jgi:hypothetical protein
MAFVCDFFNSDRLRINPDSVQVGKHYVLTYVTTAIKIYPIVVGRGRGKTIFPSPNSKKMFSLFQEYVNPSFFSSTHMECFFSFEEILG